MTLHGLGHDDELAEPTETDTNTEADTGWPWLI